ncbi:outer membrane beta-barrel protein [Aquirufa ecclesiirivi]|uniref:PorT family protein n=1 Tax=Aquirufa ecclesiirivi TaxID=2715124 RepID=A0ABT4JIJ3_9BACT|nr:outer membrane beta-barrel protein [Aquirufa ecclesiirivi]MCZ2471874.1 PorT family protein [Aquirufa ecclesiirivi]MCZ2476107.1 PorT family protein [Aquirufa ecclesiirivi]MDF0693587.1 outer membrane beta-barrel protein [Aquirufa ecclesiirivi]NHC49494.1 PorT family protein [Aquirufa ecclesiirivi]
MKNLFILGFILLSTGLLARPNQDSLLLKIDKRNQEIIGNPNNSKKSLKEELQAIFAKNGIVMEDSLWQSIRKAVQADNEKDTSIVVSIGGKNVNIKLHQTGFNGTKSVSVAKANSAGSPSSNNKQVEVGLKGIHVKEGNEEVHVGWNGVQVKEGDEVTRVIWGKDSTKIQAKDRNFYQRKGLNLYLGLNGTSGNLPAVSIAQFPAPLLSTDFGLKPMGSRYVGLEISRSIRLASNPKSRFNLGYGLQFDWYNFMFDHNRIIQKGTDAVIFQPIINSNGGETVLSKNKMTVSYVTLPIMPHWTYSKESAVQMIGLGGYVSYRLDSYTKAIEDKTDNLHKNTSNLFVNQIRYGVRAEFALKHFPDLFFSYDLSPLFEKGKGPDVQAFSFGLRLL